MEVFLFCFTIFAFIAAVWVMIVAGIILTNKYFTKYLGKDWNLL